MKKTALIASSFIVALSLVGCSALNSSTNKTTASSTNATSTMAATETKEQQKTPEATKQQTVAAEQPKIEYAFTQDKGHPEKLLIGVINEAKTNLDIAIYSLTNKDIVAAILEAKKRGVAVRIITDQQEAKAASQAEKLKQLIAAGIPIKENTHKGLMHLKVTIADKSIVTTGSFNYSAAASTTNDEVLVVIQDDVKLAQEWDAEFEKMWTDKKNYQDFKK